VLIRIDTRATGPLYEQIAAQLRHAIACGAIEPGERLPAAKDLASAVGVNVHTVLRAYAELRDADLIELRPRRGAVVRPSGPARAGLVDQVREVIAAARRQGLTAAEIIELVGGELRA
jgi:DNA-binding transcriptional regulator YhcF (GntR family)